MGLGTQLTHLSLLGFIDTWCHRLHLPHFLYRRLCDEYDRRLLR